MSGATRVKALIRNLSKEKKINAQILLRNYMLERLLERISCSEYKHSFILKGGMLVAAMVGLDTRSTMDMDATLKGVSMVKDAVKVMFEKIISIPLDDGVVLKISSMEDIHDEANYPGLRVSLETFFDGIKQMLKVDITTGDTITPRAICYRFKLMLEPRSIEVMAYNLETVLAEKLETIISRSTANTRMRDFYDVYILGETQGKNIDDQILRKALLETVKNRGTTELLGQSGIIASEVIHSKVMKEMWKRYQAQFDYAEDVSWEMVSDALVHTLSRIENETS